MITIPTTELIGCIGDVLPIAGDNKESETWGIKIDWDGEALRFAAYDILIGGQVEWTPGEGLESEDETGELIDWGGEDAPWQTFIHADQAKEIVKLFKLPAKLAFVPVRLKCSPTGNQLTVERVDSPHADRVLTIPGFPEVALNRFPLMSDKGPLPNVIPAAKLFFSNALLGAFGPVRSHGVMCVTAGDASEPVEIWIGNRFSGFIYQAGAKVHRYNVIRDGAGVL
jgi:hypothetical protein